ncbi:response regulator transcription factor, partial [Bacteroides heparinolyticus]
RDGEEGLEKANEFIPDLIITDLMMPQKDGYELCREVRKSELLNHIPIIIVTAKNNDSDRIEGLDAGADAYLQKPFNPDELHIHVQHLLEQRRMLREKYSRATNECEKQAVELSLNDKNFLMRLNDVIYSMLSNHDLSSDIVADRMCMSLSQLNRKVKIITGFSTSGYVLQMRLDKSKRLLASTETPIGDIALKCGFPEISYFSRIFKQTFQMTPSQYRKSNKEYLSRG